MKLVLEGEAKEIAAFLVEAGKRLEEKDAVEEKTAAEEKIDEFCATTAWAKEQIAQSKAVADERKRHL